MNKYDNVRTKILSLMVLLIISFNSIQAQESKLINQESFLTVLGTSSLHDWHIIAEQQSGKINFTDKAACNIKTLSISIVAESLKSGKGSMDKNTYKALKTDDFNNITFYLTEVKNVEATAESTFKVKAIGDLTIAGTKKSIPLDFTVSNVDGKTKVEGEKEIKMTDFNVEPPKALFGTITTGNEITIKFSTIFK